ncbi:MAG TPA: hypothetical protein DC024_14270 [Clostridiales bacterium]|jgi:vacuolar-type H+-ATPase subunit E/Vma4|nr:hypothetical protein [Clostridiales bacterium]
MVTIEQKLLLFSKLINHSMEKDFKDELKELEKQYSLRSDSSKDEIDAAAQSIEERARKKAEMRRTESLSKQAVNIKRGILLQKEKCYYIFMEKLKSRLTEFVNTEEYKTYLLNLIKKINITDENYDWVIYLTESDNKRYSELIKEELKKNNINIEFKNSYNIIGGLIVIDKDKNTKIDFSIDSVLEDNKTYIMQTIFDALEAGGIGE